MLPYVFRHDSVFYLFYTGWDESAKGCIGLATSHDGYHYAKYPENPVLSPGDAGFDSFRVGASVVLKEDSIWVMYYSADDLGSYMPSPYVGRATAGGLTGPWNRSETPVLTRGDKSEWDGEFLFPSSILRMDDGSYRMYYTAGADFIARKYFSIGMATSGDGIHWKKYNDPATTEHPFAESDPVLQPGIYDEWDNEGAFACTVYRVANGFEMYYGGEKRTNGNQEMSFGLASSKDGIHWVKYVNNPVYVAYIGATRRKFCEGPSICFTDSLSYLYYDYGTVEGKIGMATARIQK